VCMCVCICVSVIVDESLLSLLDPLSRLAHYVAVLSCNWSNVNENATRLRDDVDEAVEVRRRLFI